MNSDMNETALARCDPDFIFLNAVTSPLPWIPDSCRIARMKVYMSTREKLCHYYCMSGAADMYVQGSSCTQHTKSML